MALLGYAPAALANIKLNSKWLTVTNALAYCDTESITVVNFVYSSIPVRLKMLAIDKHSSFS